MGNGIKVWLGLQIMVLCSRVIQSSLLLATKPNMKAAV